MTVIYLHAGGDLKEAYGVLRQLLDAERLLNVQFKIEPHGYKILAVVVPDDNIAVALRLKFGGVLNEIDEPGTNAHRACTECRWYKADLMLLGPDYARCARPFVSRTGPAPFCDLERHYRNDDNCSPDGLYFQTRRGKIRGIFDRVVLFFSR